MIWLEVICSEVTFYLIFKFIIIIYLFFNLILFLNFTILY